MAWSSVVVNEKVDTPYGQGTVRTQSGAQGTVRVDVGGQLYDLPDDQVKRIETEEVPSQSVPEKEGSEGMLKPGLKVENRISGIKGEVTEVTQRSATVEYESGVTNKYPKKDLFKHVKSVKGSKPKSEETPKSSAELEGATEKQVTDTADTLYGLLHLQKHLEAKIEENIDEELKELKELAHSKQKLEVKVGEKVTELEGLKHKQLEQLITYSALRLSPLLVGMAGTGKTHAGEQVAKALDLPFYSMSVGAQTSKSDIIGYMDANGNYVKTHFRTAYEEGGVFLMDEIDAGNANVLIQVNAALSNGLCAFPDKMVTKHEDFIFIASANTYGNGANRQYVGRNQLDAATLDRFAVIDWYIDDKLEENLAVGLLGRAWYMAVKATRDYVAEHNIRALISPRATQKGSKLLDVGQSLEEVISATLLASVPDDKKQDVTDVTTKVFESQASGVKSELKVELADVLK